MADGTAANDIVQHYRDFYSIYIRYVTDTLTGSDSADIETLASLCPYLHGAVVYKARALYDIMFDTLRIFEDGCDSIMAGDTLLSRSGQIDNPGVLTINNEDGQKYMLCDKAKA